MTVTHNFFLPLTHIWSTHKYKSYCFRLQNRIQNPRPWPPAPGWLLWLNWLPAAVSAHLAETPHNGQRDKSGHVSPLAQTLQWHSYQRRGQSTMSTKAAVAMLPSEPVEPQPSPGSHRRCCHVKKSWHFWTSLLRKSKFPIQIQKYWEADSQNVKNIWMCLDWWLYEELFFPLMTLNCRPQLGVRIRGFRHTDLICPTESPYKTWAECLNQLSQDSGKQTVARQQGREARMYHLLFLPASVCQTECGPWVTERFQEKPSSPGWRREQRNPNSQGMQESHFLLFLSRKNHDNSCRNCPGTHKSQDFRRGLLLWIGQLWLRNGGRVLLFLFSFSTHPSLGNGLGTVA